MKTRMRINGTDIEGYLLENYVLLKKDLTAWPFRDCPGDAILALHDDDGRNDKMVRGLLRSSPVTIHVLRFVVKDGTWVFAWWERGQNKESLGLPHCFVQFPEEEYSGTFFDNDGQKLIEANFAKREHKIAERKLWQKQKRELVRKNLSVTPEKREHKLEAIAKNQQLIQELRAKASLTLEEALAKWPKIDIPGQSTKTRAKIKEAVCMYLQPEFRSLRKVAKEFNVSAKTVSTWLNTFTRETGHPVILHEKNQSVKAQVKIESQAGGKHIPKRLTSES